MSVRVALTTPLSPFANELCDVLKLFFTVDGFTVHAATETGEAEAAIFERSEPLLHTFWEEGEKWHCAFRFRGRELHREMDKPIFGEKDRKALIHKRMQKRLCKLTLYDLLKEITGASLPWGSLTGVRPTRLLYENLAQGMTLEEGAAALCEVFDVNPAKAELLSRIVKQQMVLSAPEAQDVDVYLSIPFCRTRCAYCSFPGEAIQKGTDTEAYLRALFFEMEATAELMHRLGLTLRAVYIGGGTPTALSEAEFARFIEHACVLFPSALEFTVEAGRPDTFTRGKLQALLDFGITRISINPQTMNDKTLAFIGRDHTALETVQAFALARELGFSNINMDVIAGLPGEAVQDFDHTMAEIVRLSPDSLTVHTLAIKRSSRLELQRAPLPSGDMAMQMVKLGQEAAEALHMEPYYLYRQKYMAGQQQNVGYARVGAACLYNIDIMEENSSILACGAGAISKRVFPDRELRIERAPNVSNVAVYIDRVTEMVERKIDLFL